MSEEGLCGFLTVKAAPLQEKAPLQDKEKKKAAPIAAAETNADKCSKSLTAAGPVFGKSLRKALNFAQGKSESLSPPPKESGRERGERVSLLKSLGLSRSVSRHPVSKEKEEDALDAGLGALYFSFSSMKDTGGKKVYLKNREKVVRTLHELNTQVLMPLCRHFNLRYNFFSEHHCLSKKAGITLKEPLILRKKNEEGEEVEETRHLVTIRLRLRVHPTKGNPQTEFISRGTQLAVLLHELCHLRHMNHGKEFMFFLRDIFAEARKIGVFDPESMTNEIPSPWPWENEIFRTGGEVEDDALALLYQEHKAAQKAAEAERRSSVEQKAAAEGDGTEKAAAAEVVGDAAGEAKASTAEAGGGAAASEAAQQESPVVTPDAGDAAAATPEAGAARTTTAPVGRSKSRDGTAAPRATTSRGASKEKAAPKSAGGRSRAERKSSRPPHHQVSSAPSRSRQKSASKSAPEEAKTGAKAAADEAEEGPKPAQEKEETSGGEISQGAGSPTAAPTSQVADDGEAVPPPPAPSVVRSVEHKVSPELEKLKHDNMLLAQELQRSREVLQSMAEARMLNLVAAYSSASPRVCKDTACECGDCDDAEYCDDFDQDDEDAEESDATTEEKAEWADQQEEGAVHAGSTNFDTASETRSIDSSSTPKLPPITVTSPGRQAAERRRSGLSTVPSLPRLRGQAKEG